MRSQTPLFDLAENGLVLAMSHEAELRNALNRTLRETREALHRRSRFSSRNEALDEVCKLLFAHVVALSEGDAGIPGALEEAGEPAQQLREFVRRMFEQHLPGSLAHDVPVEDFELKLKASESELALELGSAFEHLSAHSSFDVRELAADADVLNEVFGAFLNTSFIDEKQLGQYLTPPEVVKFIVDLAINALDAEERQLLLDPSTAGEFGAILDPSCGVGSFLTLFARQIYSRLRVFDEGAARRWLDEVLAWSIVGFDKSERMVRLALTNLALLGASEVNLHLLNSLARTRDDGSISDSLVGRVGLIMTNPPFGAEFRGRDLERYRIASEWSRKAPVKVDSEILFMERYVDWLRPGGRAFAIVPDSILTNRGLFLDLREALKSRIDVELVVSLPTPTFEAAGTQTKTSVVQMRKLDPEREPSPRSAAYVAVCHEIGFNIGTRGTNRLKVSNGGGQLPLILEEVRGETEQVIGRHIPNISDATRWDAIYHATLPPDIQELLLEPPEDALFVRDVAILSQDRTNPVRGKGTSFSYIEISDVDAETGSVQPKLVHRKAAPTRARKLVRPGDVLVSTVRPERQTVVALPEEADGAVCSTGFAVLRPTLIRPHVLVYLLRTPFVTAQIMRNNVGIAYPAIDETCLLDILLPITSRAMKDVDSSGDEIAHAEAAWVAARRKFQDTMSKLVSEIVERP